MSDNQLLEREKIMSISYNAQFGLGYEVKAINEIPAEYEGNLYEYLYTIHINEGFSLFEVGSYYSGEMDGVFLVVDHDFKLGNDLSESKANLDIEIKRLNLESVAEFDLVGGVLIC